MALKKITFWTYPITWTWHTVGGLVSSLLGGGGEGDVYIGTPGAIDTDDKKFSIPCIFSQIVIVSIVFYLLYRWLKSVKF